MCVCRQRPGNACKPNEFLCSTDNDEQKFMRKIVALLVTNGAKGSLFSYGEGGGAALAQQLAVNADASLPIKGVWAAAGQLLAAPARSGPGQRNFNQPNASRGTPRQVAQCASHGTADSVVPYGGGRSALHKLCGECRLMTEPASDKTWALHNGCSGQLTSTAVRATYRSPRPSGKPMIVETTAVHHVWGGCPTAAPVEWFEVKNATHGSVETIGGTPLEEVALSWFARVEAAASPTKPEEGSDLNLAIQAIVCGIALLVVCGIMFACVCATR